MREPRRRGVGRGEGVPPYHWGRSLGRGPNFFDFLSENREFWCILGGASALYVI